MPNSAKQFRGIVATGPTQQAAINQYKLLARGKNARVCVSGNDRFLASTSSDAAEMFDVCSGELGMSEDINVIKSLSFTGEDAGTVEVAYTVCESGCGTHIVADDPTFVAHCPSCGVSVNFEDEVDEEPDLLADDIDDLEDDEDTSESGDDVIDVTDDDPDEDIDAEDEDAESEDEDAESEDEDTSESKDEDDEDSEDDEEDAESDDAEDDDTESDDEDDDSEENEEDAEPEEKPAKKAKAKAKTKKAKAKKSESADEDDDSEEEDSEDEDVEDEDAESESGDPLTVCAATKAEAIDLYAAHASAIGVSTSSGDAMAFYSVCSDPSCASHLVSEVEIHVCPICQSATNNEPDNEPEDDENVDDDLEAALDDEDLDSSESEDLGVADDEDDQEAEDDEDESTDEESSESEDEELDIDAAEDEVPEDADVDDLDVSYSSSVAGKPAWTAFYKGSPVAVARCESAGRNADIFNTEKFGQATIAVARQTSVSKALKEMGFAGVSRKGAVTGAIKRHIDAQVATARTQLAADKEKFEARFIDALSTAAMGISRNFFKDVESNPLVEALLPALSAAGIVNPQAMLDRAISQSADSYHAVLFNKALDLLSKPAEVMDSLSSTIQQVNFQSTSSTSTLGQRVASFGTSVPKTEQASVSASQSVSQSASTTDFSDVVGTLGRR